MAASEEPQQSGRGEQQQQQPIGYSENSSPFSQLFSESIIAQRDRFGSAQPGALYNATGMALLSLYPHRYEGDGPWSTSTKYSQGAGVVDIARKAWFPGSRTVPLQRERIAVPRESNFSNANNLVSQTGEDGSGTDGGVGARGTRAISDLHSRRLIGKQVLGKRKNRNQTS